jgi:glycosyltransferase involved in cell wall biosynthesis
MRVVALVAAYNEERFIAQCIEHLRAQGVLVHLIDNGSDDRTVEIAERYLGDGVIAIEHFPRDGSFQWMPLLRRKAELAQELDADWFIHHDADEFRFSPERGRTLVDELEEADAAGYNAVDFMEFTFLPCAEEPDHDHARFLETMRWYHPYLPARLHRVNAFKRQKGPVDLVKSGGHVVVFDGFRLSPRTLSMRHYICLGPLHALEKYVYRRYSPEELAGGAHGWRAEVRPEHIAFPPAADLRVYEADHLLDPRNPRRTHYLADSVADAPCHGS